MWRNYLPITAAVLLGFGHVALSAQTAPDQAAQSAAENAIDEYQQAFDGRDYPAAIKALDKVSVEANNRQARALLAAMRASALLGLKRNSEADALIAQARDLAPGLSGVGDILFFGGLTTRRFDIAADALDRMIAQDPAAVREIPTESMRYLMFNEPEGQKKRNDERRVALARLGYGGDTERGHYLALNALQILVKEGDYTGAQEFIADVKEPVALENLLIQRRYESLWAKIGEAAGPNLSKARMQAVLAAERALGDAPDNHDKLANYVNALRHAGRLDDAIAIRKRLPTDIKSMSAADEGLGWTVNNVALALHEAGRKDEADQLFALLNDAPMPKEYWRVSMKINRLELLVGDGRYDRALPLVEPTASTKGSPYADQLTRRLRYCVLHHLQGSAEAAKFKAGLLAHAADAPTQTVDGLLCAGEAEEAERVALAALANPDLDKRTTFEEEFVRQLQTKPITSDDPSVWQSRWVDFRKRPLIEAAFNRLGRDMPAEFLPPAH